MGKLEKGRRTNPSTRDLWWWCSPSNEKKREGEHNTTEHKTHGRTEREKKEAVNCEGLSHLSSGALSLDDVPCCCSSFLHAPIEQAQKERELGGGGGGEEERKRGTKTTATTAHDARTWAKKKAFNALVKKGRERRAHTAWHFKFLSVLYGGRDVTRKIDLNK